eukprot:gene1499-1633_t
MSAFLAICIALIALLFTQNSAASHHGFNTTHYVEKLYHRFRKDLVGMHALMDEWTSLNKTSLVKICHAHMSVQETELLYMRVRAAKPRLVFELGPACGWSSQAILLALEHNQQGELYSYDMERKAPRVIGALSKGEVLSKRWVFTKGLVQNTYQAKTWDFVYIDALHENHFSRWYVDHILAPLTQRAYPRDTTPLIPVQIHDIYNPFLIPGGYMQCVKNAATISGIVEEIACLEEMTRKVVSEDAGVMTTTSTRNVMYGADAVSGEGSMVLDFIAFHHDHIYHFFTISPFRDLALLKSVLAIRESLKIGEGLKTTPNIYNPSIFFHI